MSKQELKCPLPKEATRSPTPVLSSSLHSDKDFTVEDAFRALEQACRAEREGHLREATDGFVNASELFSRAAESEIDERINRLLMKKASEALEWAEGLSRWRVEGREGTPPARRSRGVNVHIGGSTGIGEVDEENFAHVHRREFTDLRYTPVDTVNPINFTSDGYRLRCARRAQTPRMMIVITMYNEDAAELSSTLRKCSNNVAYLQDHKLPGYEGEEAWQNILICIVSDGRTKAHPGTLTLLQQLGMFDEDAMTIGSAGIDPQVHLFERTVVLSGLENRGIRSFFSSKSRPIPPLQLVFALKEHNAGKLHSHLWFYNGFAEQLQPEYTVLIDVGTLPTRTSFYKLLGAMEVNQQVGGVCGEIAVNRPLPNLCNWVVAAQHYEYKVSNILDKATESCYGFISVLPGAFSAYRYKAIRGAPLQAYFKSLTTSMKELGPFNGNMYLAEDRILCFELLARENCQWTMMYVKDAIARTDVPETLVDLLLQRRRWLNGSLFASLYTLFNWSRVYTDTRHSCLRKSALMVQYVLLLMQTVFAWFLLANFYLTCYYVIFYSLETNDLGFIDVSSFYASYGSHLQMLFNVSYAFMLLLQVILGLGNKPKHNLTLYLVSSLYFRFVMFMTTVLSGMVLYANKEISLYGYLIIGATIGVYFVAAALHGELHHVLLSFCQYSSLLPTMINVFMVYSFCNLHDLSWGTKGIETQHATTRRRSSLETKHYRDILNKRKALEAQQRKDAAEVDAVRRKFDTFRSNLLLLWLSTNGALVGGCLYFLTPQVYLPILFVTIAAFNLNRLIGSTLFLLYTVRQWMIFKCCLCCGILRRRHKRKMEEATQLHTPEFAMHNTPDERFTQIA